jgi:hypothetical protein
MKKVIRLTERDLTRIVRRVINEQGPYASGMGPSSNSTSTPSVNPGMKKPNLQPLPKMSLKIGDVYKITFKDGHHIRFKITSKVGNMFIGALLGVFLPKLSPGDEGFREPIIGDPIKIQSPGEKDQFTFYLPKSFGVENLGSNLSNLKKLN